MSKNPVFLALLVAFMESAASAAAPDDYAPYLDPPAHGSDLAPIAGSGRAVFGRIFGVQGSGAEIDHHVFDLTQRTPSHAAIRSALVPGWGQVFNRDHVKGILFFVTVTGTAIGSVIRYDQARDDYDDYKALGLKDSSLYDDYEDKRVQAMVLGAASVIFYAVGIVDAYRKAYEPLYSTRGRVNLALSSTEGQLVWEKRF